MTAGAQDTESLQDMGVTTPNAPRVDQLSYTSREGTLWWLMLRLDPGGVKA
jgi:hypothetical protein